MKTLLLIWSLVLGQCMAGPFFFGQQGAVATSGAAAYSWPASTLAAFESTSSGSLSDGDAIATLTSVYGAATITQGTAAARPIYKASGGSGGLAYWQFDGVNDQISGAITDTQSFTLAVICKRTGSAANNKTPIGDSGSYAGVSSRSAGGSPNTIGLYAGSAVAPTGLNAIGTWYLIVAVFNGASSQIYINGAAAATGSPGTAGVGTGMCLGQWGGIEFWTGDICAAAMFNTALSGAEVDSLRTYWNGKFTVY